MKLIIHSDGGARGNPGPAAIGVVIEDESGKVIEEVSRVIGDSTNNIAEYTAVLEGLKALKTRFTEGTSEIEIDWRLDSELVVKQLSGEYKVKNPGLREIYQDIQDLRVHFPKLHLKHVPREENKHADRLVNEALDRS